jgi:glycosyltransferase involved in cell wall biosynthesis
MRLLFNTVFYRPAAGGGGPIHSVAALAEEMVRRGHDVTVAASDRDIPGSLDVDTSRDHCINGVVVRYFRALPTLLQKTRLPAFSKAGVFTFGREFEEWLNHVGSSFDILHSHIPFACSNGPCSLYARRQGKLYFYHQRGNLDPIRLRRGFLKKWAYIVFRERPIMRRADVLFALTEYEVSTYRALGLSNRIQVLANGIDPAFAKEPDLTGYPHIESVLSATGDRVVFLFMARIHPIKGADLFVESFLRCAARLKQITALLAGPDEGDQLRSIQSRVGEMGLSDQVHYVGTVSGDARLALLRRADCFVLPTLSEGMSMSLLEALACGCAIITSPGAHFDEIESCGAGRIVAPNVDALTEVIRQFALEGTEVLRARGERGQELVRRCYTWSTIADRYEAISRELAQHCQ